MTLQGLTPEWVSAWEHQSCRYQQWKTRTAGTLGQRKWLARSKQNPYFCHYFHVGSNTYAQPWRLSVIKFSLQSCLCEAKATPAQGQSSPAGTQVFQTGDPLLLKHWAHPSPVFSGIWRTLISLHDPASPCHHCMCEMWTGKGVISNSKLDECCLTDIKG